MNDPTPGSSRCSARNGLADDGHHAAPALLQQQVDRWAETWLKTKFSRLLELRAQDPGPFNYPIAVFSVQLPIKIRMRVVAANRSSGRTMGRLVWQCSWRWRHCGKNNRRHWEWI